MAVRHESRMLHAGSVVDLYWQVNEIIDTAQNAKKHADTFIPFSPVAATILRVSNCNPVTAWSYLSVSKMPPVRRSHI